jgi:putative PEP-CTERM system histidine kinase
MSLAAYGYFLCAAGFAALLVRLAWHRRVAGAPQPSRWMLAAATTSAAWALACAAADSWRAAAPMLTATAVASVLDTARYALWFALLLGLLKPAWPATRWRGWGWGVGAVVLLNLMPAWPASAANFQLFVWLALPVTGLALLEQVFRAVPADWRWHAKPLCLALAAPCMFDAWLCSQAAVLGHADADTASMRGFAHALAVPLLFLSARRQFAWVSRFEVSRAAALQSATLVLVGVYLLFIAAGAYYVRDFGGSWGGALQVALVSMSLVLLAAMLLSAKLRATVRVLVGKHFFRYRYDYRTEWLNFTGMLSDAHAPQETGLRVVRGLASLLQSPHGALWTLDAEGTALVPAANWGLRNSLLKALAPADAFGAFVAEHEWIVELDAHRRGTLQPGEPLAPEWLLKLPQAWALVPLVTAGALTGFVVLARPHASPQLNWEVRDLLRTAARQAASILALMRATEALLEARKFDAFNRMSAFVVHDLKNIVAQLSLMTQNARRLIDNRDFQEDMLATVESSLERMRRLMLQLREGQAPAGVSSGVELLPVLQRLRTAAHAAGRELALEVLDPAVTRGHAERIERVIGHVVHNALDATAQGGSVRVVLDRVGSHARVAVHDSGCGMAPEFLHHQLFKPFSTTKDSGMGIGAYESWQYVRELGGSITAESEVGRGTDIVILLPLFETRQRPDLVLVSAR